MTKREESRESSSMPRLVKPMVPEGRASSARERRAAADEIPPALQLMLETLRRALLMAAHAIGKYLGREN